MRERITYLELNVNQDFMNRFSAAKFLPHTNTSLFPSVKTA
ncbi:MAG: ASKHA domain-containing protein [Desulfobacterales bacterium]